MDAGNLWNNFYIHRLVNIVLKLKKKKYMQGWLKYKNSKEKFFWSMEMPSQLVKKNQMMENY